MDDWEHGALAESVAYDEFGYFGEIADELGLSYDRSPLVRREFVEVAPGRRISGILWGAADPELLLLHGGPQNAHTWDAMAMALDRPFVALDLPGHGHSDRQRRGPTG